MKVIPKKIKQKVLVDLAKQDLTKKDIENKYHITYPTIQRILVNNQEQFKIIVDNLRQGLNAKCLWKANFAVDNTKSKEIKSLNALQKSQFAKNLSDISKNDISNQLNIQINIPNNRDDLISLITQQTDTIKTIDNTIDNDIDKP
jgi:hypothetical protein